MRLSATDIGVARLDDCSAEELYRMLPDQKQMDIWEDFVGDHLDTHDLMDWLDAVYQDTVTPEKRRQLHRRWGAYLDRKDLRNRYASDLEEAAAA
jgi:hypothetical protein